jgi:hypothetical protein
MTAKLLLSTLATAAVLFGAPAYSADEKAHADGKAHVKCDPAKDKDCKDEHKAGDKHDDKEGKGHSEKEDHGKDEMKK